jgi:hypothetical protein
MKQDIAIFQKLNVVMPGVTGLRATSLVRPEDLPIGVADCDDVLAVRSAGENQSLGICLSVALYRLLSSVNKHWALLMVGFVWVSAAVGFLNTLNDLTAVIFFRGADFLAMFDKAQRDALGMFFIKLHTQGIFIDEIFWGVWLFPFGWLVFRSGFLPRFLGVWLILGCFGWVSLSAIAIFSPIYYEAAFRWLQPVFFAELAFMLWVLIRGANVQALSAQTV